MGCYGDDSGNTLFLCPHNVRGARGIMFRTCLFVRVSLCQSHLEVHLVCFVYISAFPNPRSTHGKESFLLHYRLMTNELMAKFNVSGNKGKLALHKTAAYQVILGRWCGIYFFFNMARYYIIMVTQLWWSMSC